MKMITIPEDDYLLIQRTIKDLKNQAEQMQYFDFAEKLSLTYHLVLKKKANAGEKTNKISLKRGAGKDIITYMAEDFDAPLEDFKEYKDMKNI